MSNVIAFSLLILGCLGLPTLFVAAIISILKKRWRTLLVCMGFVFLSATLIAGASMWYAYRAASVVAVKSRETVDKWHRESERRTVQAALIEHEAIQLRAAAMIKLTPESLRPGIDDEFWSTEGYLIGTADHFDFRTVCNPSILWSSVVYA